MTKEPFFYRCNQQKSAENDAECIYFQTQRCWQMTGRGGRCPKFIRSFRYHRTYTDTAGLSISHHQEELPGTGSGLALHFGAHLILFCFFLSSNRPIRTKFAWEQTTSLAACRETAVRVTEDVAHISKWTNRIHGIPSAEDRYVSADAVVEWILNCLVYVTIQQNQKKTWMGLKINTKNRFICPISHRDLEAQWLCGCDVKEIKNNNRNIFSWPLRRQWSVGWDNERRFDSRHESDLRTLWLHEASAATAIVSFPLTPYLIEQRCVTCTNLHGHMTLCVFYVSTRLINAHFTQTL